MTKQPRNRPFKLGDRVRVIATGQNGVIQFDHQSGNWTVKFSDGTREIITEKDLKRI